MATLNELGQKVKAKHLGQYDDIDDAEVGRRVQAKFPGQYDDFKGALPSSTLPAPRDATQIAEAQKQILHGAATGQTGAAQPPKPAALQPPPDPTNGAAPGSQGGGLTAIAGT